MIDVEKLGWEPDTVGELDHQLLKAPHVKLRSYTEGPGPGVVYSVDLRITRPNREFLSTTEMHSFEHFLLDGFRKHLPENFLSVGLMGCQTGFYLVLFNEGRAEEICRVYGEVLSEIMIADEVPYANAAQCGNYKNHSVESAQTLAQRVLDKRAGWRTVV